MFTSNKATAAPVQRQPGPPGRHRRAGRRPSSSTAAAPTPPPAPPATPTRSGCAPWWRPHLGCAADEVLVCSTGLIGYYLPMAAVEAGHPARWSPPAGRTAAPAAAQAIMTTDTVPKEVSVTVNGYTVGGMAKGAAMLAPDMATMLAVLTTDAVADPDRAPGPAAGGGGRLVQPPRGRRLHVDQRHRDRAGQRPLRPAPGDVGASPRPAPSWPSRWRPTPRGPPSWPGSGSTGPRPTTTPAGRPARWPRASSSSARCSARTPTGAGSSASWAARAPPSTPTWSRSSYGGVEVCRDGVAADHDEAAVAGAPGRAPRRRSPPTWAWATGRAAMLFTDLTPAYIDENMGTS